MLIQSAVAFDENSVVNSFIYWGDKDKHYEDPEKHLFKGTGLMMFVDYLLLRELSRQGIKKWLGNVDRDEESIAFADFKRFDNKGKAGIRTRKVPQIGGEKNLREQRA